MLGISTPDWIALGVLSKRFGRLIVKKKLDRSMVATDLVVLCGDVMKWLIQLVSIHRITTTLMMGCIR